LFSYTNTKRIRRIVNRTVSRHRTANNFRGLTAPFLLPHHHRIG
jgi:hypothetical protein